MKNLKDGRENKTVPERKRKRQRKETETIKETSEVLKRLPEFPKVMDKANQALSYLASGKIPNNSNSFSALKEKELELKSFRNQSIVGLLLLVFFAFIVF